MKPDTSRRRDDASYDYFDNLSVEGLAWECLRRDEAYQDHYLSLVITGAGAEPLLREVEQRWGSNFAARPSLSALGQTVLWSAAVNPAVVLLGPSPEFLPSVGTGGMARSGCKIAPKGNTPSVAWALVRLSFCSCRTLIPMPQWRR
ncbi:transcriptional regulator domain-containing protein [Azorhizobium doebereinerae]|uniref:transcriptional regulator domain-containing protein n=1 Tax=Azorhizobium doebereinerae TaxID=281091 RepID=UPI0006846B9B|nr:DUF6499 domain-containing protein [Azorhizobium doebereinerae]